MKVITYMTPRGEYIDITPKQEQRMRSAGVWPRSQLDGQEYCSVHCGLHHGYPSMTDAQVDAMIAREQ